MKLHFYKKNHYDGPEGVFYHIVRDEIFTLTNKEIMTFYNTEKKVLSWLYVYDIRAPLVSKRGVTILDLKKIAVRIGDL